MRRVGASVLSAAAIAGLLVLVPAAPTVRAAGPQAHNWTGTQSSNWGDGKNWDDQKTPQSGDIVSITSGSNMPTLNVPDITLLEFTLGGDVVVGSPGADPQGSITASKVTLNGGTSYVPITNSPLPLTPDGMTLMQTDSEVPISLYGDLVGNGVTTMFGGTTLKTYFDSDVINNGTWRVVQGLEPIVSNISTIAINRCCIPGSGMFDNHGTIDQIGDPATLRIENGVYVGRSGSEIKAKVELSGGEPRFGGTSKVTGSQARLSISDGAVLKQLLTATPTIQLRNGATFRQASEAVVNAPVTFTRAGTGTATYDWYSGDITEGITIDTDVQMHVRTDAARRYQPPTTTTDLKNKGKIVIHGKPDITLFGRIVNTGTITVASNKAPLLTGYSCCTAPIRIINSGTIDASATGASFTVSSAALWSVGPDSKLKGTVILDGGRNRLGNGLTLVGSATRVSQVNGGTLYGDGNLEIGDGSQLIVRGTSYIRGTPDFTIDGKGTFVWNSGYLLGHMTIGKNATMLVVDAAGEVSPFREVTTEESDTLLVNEGTVVQKANINLHGWSDDAIVRNAGTWKLTKGGVLDSGACILRNTGTLIVDGKNRTMRWNADFVVTSGDIDIKAGDLFVEAQNRFLQTDGTVRLRNEGTLYSSKPYEINDGIFTGRGGVEADIVNGGEVRPGPGKVTLKILGDYRQRDSGRLTIELNGSSSSHLQVTGLATLGGMVRIITGGSLPIKGTGEEFLTAGSRIGTFDSLSSADADKLRLAYLAAGVLVLRR